MSCSTVSNPGGETANPRGRPPQRQWHALWHPLDGGESNGGIVFSITTSGADTVLHGFNRKKGKDPQAGLINVRGTLYGTTGERGPAATAK